MAAMRPGLPDPLVDLLGARWTLGAPVAAIAWLAGGRAAFGLGDGTVALAPAAWEGAARLQPRAEGGVELVPAAAPPPPAMRVGVHGGPCVAVASAGETAITGGADGRIARIAADGSIEILASLPDARLSVAAAAGASAWADGRRVWRGDGAVLDLPAAVTALAFDPAGQTLAIGYSDGVSLLCGSSSRILALPGRPEALAWSADGRHLAAAVGDAVCLWVLPDVAAQRLGGYEHPPLSLSFAPGGLLATSGDARVVVWPLGQPPAQRRTCGPPSSSIVTRIACHPARPLIAAGYENGAVLVCQPDAPDLLFVRMAGGGSVSSLAWSPDGGHLALAVACGEAAIVAFPDLLFRAVPRAPARSEAA